MAGPITYGDPSKYNIGVSGGGYVPPGPLPGYGPPPPPTSGTQTHDSQHAISNMSQGLTPSSLPSGQASQPGNPYSSGGTYYGSPIPASTGNQFQDIGNLVNSYPGDHTVFSGFDASGNPTGMNPMFQMTKPDHVQPGQDFTNAERNVDDLDMQAHDPGDTALASAQLQKLATGYQTNVDQTNKNVDNATTQGLSQLAMTGGLSSGARTRLAQNGQATGINAQQSGANQYLQGQQGIRADDAAWKQNIQTQLPGMEQGLDQYQTGMDFHNDAVDMGVDQFNKSVGIQGLGQMTDYDKGKYDFIGNVYGSAYSAGGGGIPGAGSGPGGVFTYQDLVAGKTPPPGTDIRMGQLPGDPEKDNPHLNPVHQAGSDLSKGYHSAFGVGY